LYYIGIATIVVSEGSSARKLNKAESRAASLAKLVQILQGRSGIRGEVVEHMASLLNSDTVPEFEVSESEGE